MVLLELQEGVIVAKLKILVFIGSVFLNVKQIVLGEALCLCVFAFLFLQAKILLFYLQCLILSLRLLHAFTQKDAKC